MSQFLSPPPDSAPVVITNDGGGLVTHYEEMAWRYRMEGRRVEIRGSCRSACTLALSVPNVCVGPGAMVKFHHAYEVQTRVAREDVTSRMLSQMPSAVQNEVYGKIRVNYAPGAILDYGKLRSLGISDCNDPVTRVAIRPIKRKPELKDATLAIKFPFLPPINIGKWFGETLGRK